MRKLVFAASLFLAAAACDNDPVAGKPEAVVKEAVEVPAAPATKSAETVNYRFSNEGSSIGFVGAKVTGKHEGGFPNFEGTIDWAGDDASGLTVNVTIDTTTLESDHPKLTQHLRDADFFDVAQFPKATFVSTSIAEGGEGSATHTVTGNLELHGVTKSITFPATIQKADGKVNVNAEFAIQRFDFGIVYPGRADDLIEDAVLLKLNVAAAS